mmetsp:Transcript_36954/g.35663  ORF Transcript_36954/g.35663 Transcript_36954/m.35663 type:complete len:253 (+) Transcript_36954:1060-1818(+)
MQSADETGATNLRHDPQVLDKIIQVFQLTPHELKAHDKKHTLLAALRVLSNIITKGKSEDPNQDITKSSSLPTLLISLMRNILKSDLSYPDLVGELIKNIALIGKSSFNKSVGIEPIFMKGFIPMIPYLLKEQSNLRLQLLSLKALGVFVNHSSLIPIKMQNLYKDIMETKISNDLCNIIGSSSSHPSLQKVALHVLSILINPIYGDTFSFPWKRGPHDNINEYFEVVPIFEQVRSSVFQCLSEFDFMTRFA